MADRELSSSNTLATYIYVTIRTWLSRTTGTFPFWCHHFYEGALSNQSYAPWVPHPSLFCASSLIVVLFSPSKNTHTRFWSLYWMAQSPKIQTFCLFCIRFLKEEKYQLPDYELKSSTPALDIISIKGFICWYIKLSAGCGRISKNRKLMVRSTCAFTERFFFFFFGQFWVCHNK